MVKFAQNCPLLRKISLKNCLQLKDIVGVQLAEHCIWLTHVYFDGCQEISDSGVIPIAKKCLFLECISLRNCTEISAFSLIHLSVVPTLTHLTVDGCVKIQGEGITYIAKHRPPLETLSFSHIDISFSADFLVSVIAVLSKLTTLDLSSTNFSDSIGYKVRIIRL